MRTRWRVMPVDTCDIEGVSNYFNKMAEKGYFIKKIGTFAHFRKGEARRATYHLEPLTKKETRPEEELIAYFQETRWEYVCTITGLFHVYVSFEEEPIAIHTDHVVQSYAYEHLHKELKDSQHGMIVMHICGILVLLVSAFMLSDPIQNMIISPIGPYQLVLVLWYAYCIYTMYDKRRKIKRIATQLKEGRGSLQNKSRHKRGYAINYRPLISWGIVMVINILLLCVGLYSDKESYYKNLDTYEEELPVVRLAVIEESTNLIQDKSTTEGIDYRNNVSYKWSILSSNYIFQFVSDDG